MKKETFCDFVLEIQITVKCVAVWSTKKNGDTINDWEYGSHCEIASLYYLKKPMQFGGGDAV